MAIFDAIADLPLRIDDYALEGLARDVSSDFTRYSTVIRLRGAGEEGVGEDVSYAEDAHTRSVDARSSTWSPARDHGSSSVSTLAASKAVL